LIFSLVAVDEVTRVAEARRLAVSAARAEGLDETAVEQVGIMATEMATNLLKHAISGQLHLYRLFHTGYAGVEILSVDRGPGMSNLQACMQDGFSTSGTAGNGLGAISRLASSFDGFSQPGRGTVLVARKYLKPATGPRWIFGAAMSPYPGETVCGDSWGVRQFGNGASLMVADGLGHGLAASDASTAAVTAFRTAAVDTAVAVIEDIHRALRSTRGAAVAVAMIDENMRRLRYAGIGNISGVVLGGARAQSMVSHNGTAGLEARHLQQFDYPLPEEPVIIMHTDGLTTNWSLDGYPGLLRRDPSVIAGVLYRDAARGRDDVCVVSGRFLRG